MINMRKSKVLWEIMKNFCDSKISIRLLDPKLKIWLDKKGGSKFVRNLIIYAYEQMEKTNYVPPEIE